MPKESYKYFEANRPWLNIYGTRIRPIQPVGSYSSKPVADNCLLHRTLPDELLYEVFIRMAPYTLGLATCVCRKWRYAIRSPSLWRNACLKAWQITNVEENEMIVSKSYGGSWFRMWLQRPRLRFDGLFVSRNTYVRAGIAEWKIANPVHLVCYFRYIRFYPNGRFLYKNSSLKLKEVANIMDGRPSKIASVFGGHYTLTNEQVQAAIIYPGLRPTVLRFHLRVRGTTPGANNRLDLLSLITCGINETEASRFEDVIGVTDGWQEDETHNVDVPAVSHGRGLAPFVFVPWEEIETSVLNFPVETMDYYVPG